MKNLYLLLCIVFFSANGLFAQNQLFFDDFESYTAGEKLVNQTTLPEWTTWDRTKGKANDPYIVDDQAKNGTKSVNIVTNNDLVLLLNDKNTGRYQADFYLLVNEGFGAYFNLLQHFAGSNSEWGTQVFFKDDGTGYVDAGAAKAAVFSYKHGVWIHVDIIVDIDDDFATLYFDNNELISWKWSTGSFGADSTDRLDAINFYGWTNDTTKIGSNFFIDDVKISDVPAFNAPANLSASVDGGNISLTWDSPETPADSYLIMRNGKVIAKGITETQYVDTNLYPENYIYTVRAQYNGLGYSSSSNEAKATIEGGVKRNLVLFEINTGTWCQYCPGAAMGADDLVENGLNVAIIEYHNGDDYVTSDCAIRENYYTVTGFPTTHADGIESNVGGSQTESIYPAFLTLFNKRKDIPSVNVLDLQIVPTGKDRYKATITLEQNFPYFTNGLRLRTALTESHIAEFWQNQTELNFVCREMYPNAIGTKVDFSESTIQNYEFDFTLNKLKGYVKDNCEFIAFVQHDPTLEVVQTAKVEMSTVVGVKDATQYKVTLSPNPASGYFRIQTNGFGKIQIFNSVGQLLLTKNIHNIHEYIDIHKFNAGMYIVKITNNNQVYYKRLIVE